MAVAARKSNVTKSQRAIHTVKSVLCMRRERRIRL